MFLDVYVYDVGYKTLFRIFKKEICFFGRVKRIMKKEKFVGGMSWGFWGNRELFCREVFIFIGLFV